MNLTFSAAIPDMFILAMTSFILLVDVCLQEKWRIVTYILAQLTLIIGLFLVIAQYRDYPQPIITFSGHFVLDKLAVITKIFILITAIFSFIYARLYVKERK